jgi:pyruvate kinase
MNDLASLQFELEQLEARIDDAEARAQRTLASVHPRFRGSAANFIAYLALRGVDLRGLQVDLHRCGLSSLGRLEGHVRTSIEQVRRRVTAAPAAGDTAIREQAGPTEEKAKQLLHRHTQDLLGPKPSGRHVYIMVTAPAASIVDDAWCGRLIDAGMNVLRINGAHESETEWRHIVETARRASAGKKAHLRILVDLPGPKLRTVASCPGIRVAKWKPTRDVFGRVTAPCSVTLRPDDSFGTRAEGPTMSVPRALFSALRPGDSLVLRDARQRKRRLRVVRATPTHVVAELTRTAYVVPDTRIEARRESVALGSFSIGEIDPLPVRWLLQQGDTVRLEPAPVEQRTLESGLPVIGCSSPEAMLLLKPGARVFFDDGKIECVAESRVDRGMLLRVVRAPAGGAKLGVEKGINLPDTPLDSLAWSQDDQRALAFATSFADMVGASFIQSADSVRDLYGRLEKCAPADFGVLLKIETAAAFTELPAIMLAAMTRYPVGIMIARGDLAVEVGVQRLAELQEEILWLCEAAHLPAIWATQVLDQLAQKGVATRAEVTDAAMSVRAECVMLNKGPRVVEAVETLVDILHRMECHQYKKRTLLRRLDVAGGSLPFVENARVKSALLQ